MENKVRWSIEHTFMPRISRSQMHLHPLYVPISIRVEGKDMEIAEMEFRDHLERDLFRLRPIVIYTYNQMIKEY